MLSEESVNNALRLMKARLNRLPGDTSLDEYLSERIKAAAAELKEKGIILDPQDSADTTLVVDLAAWNYGSRDKQTGMPDWLKLRIRERWLHERVT